MAHGSESNGPVSNGTGANGTGANGTVANGTVANGAVANGAVANGTVANGTVANGSVTPQIPASQRGRASRRRAAEEVCGVADAAGQNTPDTSDTPRASSTSDAERECFDLWCVMSGDYHSCVGAESVRHVDSAGIQRLG